MAALVATTKATAAANLESFNIMSPVLFLRQFGRNIGLNSFQHHARTNSLIIH
jgi:hypothetical protein